MTQPRPMDERLETVLAECLEAIDRGAPVEACLARYPADADTLRPYLELHTQMLRTAVPEPSAAAFEAGRQALLTQVQQTTPSRRQDVIASLHGWLTGLAASARSFSGMRLARAAAMGAVVFLLAGGALGAAAAGGVEPAQEVLSALGLPSGSSHDDDAAQLVTDDARADQPPAQRADGTDDAAQTLCVPEADEETTPVLSEYGIPVCTQEQLSALMDDYLPEDACLPEAVFERFPDLQEHDIAVCTPDQVVDLIVRHLPEDACLPEAVFERYPPLRETDIAVCPTEPSGEPAVPGAPTVPATPVPTPVPPLSLPTIEVPGDMPLSDSTDLATPSNLATQVPEGEEPTLVPESDLPVTIELPEDWNIESVDDTPIDVPLP